jgi:hypothetical protein
MVFFLGLGCIIGGFIMIMPLFMEKHPGLKVVDERLSAYKIIIGLAILIIGAIAFIVPYHGRGKPLIPFLGDLLPSIFSIITGLFISVEFLETLKGVKGPFIDKLKTGLSKYQFPIGFASIFFGLLHWFIYKVIFF